MLAPTNLNKNEFLLLKYLLDNLNELIQKGVLPALNNRDKIDLIQNTAKQLAKNIPNPKVPLKLSKDQMKIALKAVQAMKKNPAFKFDFKLLFKDKLTAKERTKLVGQIKALLSEMTAPVLSKLKPKENPTLTLDELAENLVHNLNKNKNKRLNSEEKNDLKQLNNRPGAEEHLAKNITTAVGGAIIVLPFAGYDFEEKQTLESDLAQGEEETLEEEGVIPQSADEFRKSESPHPPGGPSEDDDYDEDPAFSIDAIAALVADILAEKSAEEALLNDSANNEEEMENTASNSNSPFKTPRFVPPGSGKG